jgi:hypothetical protein
MFDLICEPVKALASTQIQPTLKVLLLQFIVETATANLRIVGFWIGAFFGPFG